MVAALRARRQPFAAQDWQKRWVAYPMSATRET
jgi:hypothetical protein